MYIEHLRRSRNRGVYKHEGSDNCQVSGCGHSMLLTAGTEAQTTPTYRMQTPWSFVVGSSRSLRHSDMSTSIRTRLPPQLKTECDSFLCLRFVLH